MEPPVATITHAIQLAVAPVFLLTAVATLINVMHGRLSRIVDRRRVVQERICRSQDAASVADDQQELAKLDQRANLVYRAIQFAVLSSLLTCLVVAGAFVGALVVWDVSRWLAGLFIFTMLSLIVALFVFLREIHLAVRAGGHRRR